jgi:hypothetical protein
MTNLQSFYGAGVVTLSRAPAVRVAGVTRILNRACDPRCLRDTVSRDTVSQDVRGDAQVRRLARHRGQLPRWIGLPGRM